jgi:hypothetical protein
MKSKIWNETLTVLAIAFLFQYCETQLIAFLDKDTA